MTVQKEKEIENYIKFVKSTIQYSEEDALTYLFCNLNAEFGEYFDVCDALEIATKASNFNDFLLLHMQKESELSDILWMLTAIAIEFEREDLVYSIGDCRNVANDSRDNLFIYLSVLSGYYAKQVRKYGTAFAKFKIKSNPDFILDQIRIYIENFNRILFENNLTIYDSIEINTNKLTKRKEKGTISNIEHKDS